VKFFELVYFIHRAKEFKRVIFIKRVDENVLRVCFDGGEYLFDMRRGNSLIYPVPKNFVESKTYHSPFDKQLSLNFTNALILNFSLLNNDKILSLKCQKLGKYKSKKSELIFEFTGKFTNVIIVDEDKKITEALHHIDKSISAREIKIAKTYTLPPKPTFEFISGNIDDIDSYLQNLHQQRAKKEFKNLKNMYLLRLDKKKKKLQNILASLENEKDLITKANYYKQKADLLLANIYHIKQHQKTVILKDFENKEVKIEIDNSKPLNLFIDELYKNSKKLKQKVKNINIERENLLQKIDFYKKFINIVQNAVDKNELTLLFPKKEKEKKKQKDDLFLKFVFKDYTLLLGKNKKENANLLKIAKANDIWLHLKDLPSSHVIIKTSKKNIPADVLEFGAKLCAKFSNCKGVCDVDYTQRRNVKIIKDADVEYKFYKTLTIKV